MASNVVLGKRLPNLKISVESDSEEDEGALEEGELSDDTEAKSNFDSRKNDSGTNVVQPRFKSFQNPKTYENTGGCFVTGLDLSSEELKRKLEDRAQRFGIQSEESKPITQDDIDALYRSLDIDPEKLESGKLKNIRLDALHVRGVEEMSTQDVFKYFGVYAPAFMEWINDFSCNVVWFDKTSAARAMIGLGKPLVLKSKKLENENKDTKDLTKEKNKEKSNAKEESDAEEQSVDLEDSDDEGQRYHEQPNICQNICA